MTGLVFPEEVILSDFISAWTGLFLYFGGTTSVKLEEISFHPSSSVCDCGILVYYFCTAFLIYFDLLWMPFLKQNFFALSLWIYYEFLVYFLLGKINKSLDGSNTWLCCLEFNTAGKFDHRLLTITTVVKPIWFASTGTYILQWIFKK